MSEFTASLPMYNLPEMAAANSAFWQAIAAELAAEGVGDVPTALVGRTPVPDGIGPEVLFSQTCGYPLQTIYRGQATLLGIPTYGAPGCGEGTHRAFILVHADSAVRTPDDLAGSVFALNSRHSNSGMNLPRLLFARLARGRPFFGSVVETGGHIPSLERVASGEAAACSVDCLTYAFLRDHRPVAVSALRVLAETGESPAIPFVTSAATPPDRVAALRRALARVGVEPRHEAARAGLRIRSIAAPDPAGYVVLLDREREAAALGYPELA